MGYSTDLFDEPTIARMLSHFESLAAAAVANPDRRLSQLALMTEAEQQQLLIDWNRTQADFPQNACLHELFEAQVGRTPHETAAVCEGRDITYRELNDRAESGWPIGSQQGVGPDVLVALYLERSLDVIIGMMGVLKAGGGFLPIDAALPPERVQYMLSDAQVRAVVTHAALRQTVERDGSDARQCAHICLDTDAAMLVAEEAADPPRLTSPHNLAYAIYTSGSTGRPKGVLIEHRSVVNVVTSFIRSYDVGPADRVLQSAVDLVRRGNQRGVPGFVHAPRSSCPIRTNASISTDWRRLCVTTT